MSEKNIHGTAQLKMKGTVQGKKNVIKGTPLLKYKQRHGPKRKGTATTNDQAGEEYQITTDIIKIKGMAKISAMAKKKKKGTTVKH